MPADYLTTTKASLGLEDVANRDIAVVTNPPFVSHGEDGARDPSLASSFVQHALSMADTVVMLLPARYARAEWQEGAMAGCGREVACWTVGDVRRAKFQMGGNVKEVTQPSVFVVFRVCHDSGVTLSMGSV